MPYFCLPRFRRTAVRSVLPALAAALLAAPLHAQTAFPATLAGHVVMQAQSFIAAPKDAPQDLQLVCRIMYISVHLND